MEYFLPTVTSTTAATRGQASIQYSNSILWGSWPTKLSVDVLASFIYIRTIFGYILSKKNADENLNTQHRSDPSISIWITKKLGTFFLV